MVSTHLENITQIGSNPQGGMNIKNIWNHPLAYILGVENPSFFHGFWGPRLTGKRKDQPGSDRGSSAVLVDGDHRDL